MKYKKFKIKENREAQWRAWCAYLVTHKIEVIETLKEEQVTHEVCWIKDGFVYYGMEGHMLPATEREINIQHRKNRKECLELLGEFDSEIPSSAEELFNFIVDKES